MDLFNILKLNTSYIVKHNYVVDLTFQEAKKENLVVALGDNQLLNFIRQIRDNPYDKDYISNLYKKRDELKTGDSKKNLNKIIAIQNEINEKLFVPDLVSIKVDTTKKDYKYLCKNHFQVKVTINDKNYSYSYKRLCAGAGQLRRNSALFVNVEIADELEQVMMCGLTKKKIGKINLSKFGAYFALYTSAASKVKTPRICVIKDYEFTLKNQKISWIFDNDKGEKDIEVRTMDIEQNAFDGSGMVSPEMAMRWQEDLSLDYLPSSFIIRGPWLKGLVSIFDFKRFAKEVAHKDVIVDLWGQEYNVNDIDVILTSSQFKLYKKYSNFNEYLFYFHKYHHMFSVARVNKKENNFVTPLNYQYIQSNNFTKESIKELANFSVDWIQKIMTRDKLYAMLFLLGCQDEEAEINKIEQSTNSYLAKAMMYDDSILNDEYVKTKICQMIDKKISQAKVGKLFVEGSYDLVIPDLYAMAQWAFGMEVTGLLPEKYSWNKRWVDKGVKVVSMQRSPLVAPAENQLRYIELGDECRDWFSYIQSGMVMSIKDSSMCRCSDAD